MPEWRNGRRSRLKSAARKGVWVRLPPPAPAPKHTYPRKRDRGRRSAGHGSFRCLSFGFASPGDFRGTNSGPARIGHGPCPAGTIGKPDGWKAPTYAPQGWIRRRSAERSYGGTSEERGGRPSSDGRIARAGLIGAGSRANSEPGALRPKGARQNTRLLRRTSRYAGVSPEYFATVLDPRAAFCQRLNH